MAGSRRPASTTLVWLAVPAVVIPTYATFHIANTVIDRYQESGWGDGLEGCRT